MNTIPEINWRSNMRMRDIISHHYFEIDAEVIFESIKQDIPVLQRTIRQIISDNSTANI
ncbi:HepT-like ribonuclease domain-containing protein [Parabacteroides chinchillae]